MDSSSKNEPIITFQVVKQHAVKEISIPRHKPVTVIRKAVHITDSGSKEKAIMGSLIATLNLLGIFLYWWEDAGCFPFLNIVWKHKQCGEMEAIHWDTMVIWRLMNLWKKKKGLDIYLKLNLIYFTCKTRTETFHFPGIKWDFSSSFSEENNALLPLCGLKPAKFAARLLLEVPRFRLLRRAV